MKPLVSVLIITYNHEDYIAQTLDSVLNQQTNFDFEVVVGDDCSKDRTVEILNAYAQRHTNVRVLTTAKNLGVVPNCIRTLTACQGKYVAHLDGDDYWIDNLKLQKQFDRLEADANMTICYTARKVFREDWAANNFEVTDKTIQAEIKDRQADERGFYNIHDGEANTPYYAKDFAGTAFFHLSTIMFRKPTEKAIIDKLSTFKNIFDRPLSIVLLEEMGGYAVQIPDVCAVFRMNNSSTFTDIAEAKRIRMTNAMYETLKTLYPHLATIINQNLNVSDYFLLRLAHRDKDKPTVRSLTKQILRRSTAGSDWKLKVKTALHIPMVLMG
jgi:glycosyltransferase involved in cell wall biosynthesis